jgi:hypothetical protein
MYKNFEISKTFFMNKTMGYGMFQPTY